MLVYCTYISGSDIHLNRMAVHVSNIICNVTMVNHSTYIYFLIDMYIIQQSNFLHISDDP